MLYGMKFMEKKRKSPKMINIDKHKNIDGYVSKLTVIINDKIKLMKTIIMRTIGFIMFNIKNETNMVNEKIHKASDIDNDTLHLIDDNLNEIITYLIERLKNFFKKKLKTISVYQTNCHKILGGNTYNKKITSDNTNNCVTRLWENTYSKKITIDNTNNCVTKLWGKYLQQK